jgi:hypothetical protein
MWGDDVGQKRQGGEKEQPLVVLEMEPFNSGDVRGRDHGCWRNELPGLAGRARIEEYYRYGSELSQCSKSAGKDMDVVADLW